MRARARYEQPETLIQQHVIQYLKLAHPSILYCASAGGVRTSYKQAVKMKSTGYVRGFPDLFIYEPNGQFSGLAIEIKTEKGVASIHQKEWIKKLNDRGYFAAICKGYEHVVKTIDSYLKSEY
jgi:hypothetical protein